jgi:hypothetical protein
MAHTLWVEGEVSLKWGVCVDGYKVDYSRSQWSPVLIPASEEFRTYNLKLGSERATRLVRDFLATADRDATGSDAVLGFVNKWGLLSSIRGPEGIGELRWARYDMDRVLSGAEPQEKRLGRAAGAIEGIKLDSMHTNIRNALGAGLFGCRALLDFCWLEVFYAVDDNVTIVKCSQCADVFLRSKKGRAPNVCSARCRQRKHRKTLRKSTKPRRPAA